mmetsp:Transcript_22683/g.63768  ORF Transcript_22683/g.63768 Transcript_22683/m.63768 type:complete len:238 (-) Transcript_22683:87-800(-)
MFSVDFCILRENPGVPSGGRSPPEPRGLRRLAVTFTGVPPALCASPAPRRVWPAWTDERMCGTDERDMLSRRAPRSLLSAVSHSASSSSDLRSARELAVCTITLCDRSSPSSLSPSVAAVPRAAMADTSIECTMGSRTRGDRREKSTAPRLAGSPRGERARAGEVRPLVPAEEPAVSVGVTAGLSAPRRELSNKLQAESPWRGGRARRGERQPPIILGDERMATFMSPTAPLDPPLR